MHAPVLPALELLRFMGCAPKGRMMLGLRRHRSRFAFGAELTIEVLGLRQYCQALHARRKNLVRKSGLASAVLP